MTCGYCRNEPGFGMAGEHCAICGMPFGLPESFRDRVVRRMCDAMNGAKDGEVWTNEHCRILSAVVDVVACGWDDLCKDYEEAER